MKKLFSSLAMLAVTLTVLAETPGLKGTWVEETKMFGISTSESFTFSDDNNGTVELTMSCAIDIESSGTKLCGSSKGTVKGKFLSYGETVAVEWDKDSFKIEQEPYVAEVNGKKISEEDLNEMKASMQEDMEAFRNKLERGTVYTDVRIKRNTLSLTATNKNGEEEIIKLKRVK